MHRAVAAFPARILILHWSSHAHVKGVSIWDFFLLHYTVTPYCILI